MQTIHRTVVALVMTLSIFIVTPTAAILCIPVTSPSEANVRSGDDRGFHVAIYQDTLGTMPATAAADVNASLTSSTGIEIEAVLFQTASTPMVVILSMKQQPDYDIFRNETIRFNLPGTFFTGGVGCDDVTLHIRPVGGRIPLNTIPILNEIQVNNQRTEFLFTVQHDHFMNHHVRIHETLPDGLKISFELPTPAPSSSIKVTVHKNNTFNIPAASVTTATFIFRGEMMRSGLSPILGDGVLQQSARLEIQGSSADVEAFYDTTISGDGVLSEMMWDGGGVVHLDLAGDTWIQDEDRWSHPDYEPLFTVITKPKQPFGFEFFLSKGLRPTVSLTRRRVTLTFPPCPGFTLSSSAIESVSISRLNTLVTESVPLSTTFRVVKVKPQSIFLKWYGYPFSMKMLESEVRKDGLQISVVIKYDVFSSGANIVNVKQMFHGVPKLQLSTLTYAIYNHTKLVITIPPQITYNIDRAEMFNLTLSSNMISTSSTILKPRTGFIIYPLAVTPTCATMPGTILDEEMIRTRSDVNVTVIISSGNDEFCYTDEAKRTLMESITSQNGQLKYTLKEENAKSLVIGIDQDATYDLNSNEVLVIPLPTELMCSLEMCAPDPAPSERYPPNAITMAVKTTSGRLLINMPALSESVMRNQPLVVEMYISGDKFARLQFTPQFIVKGKEGDRGFLASIASQCRANRDINNNSRAVLTCPSNSSYDISADEEVGVVLPSSFVDSNILPNIEGVVPLRVSVAQGVIVSTVPRNITISEEQIVAGGYTMELVVLNDRWRSPLTLSNVARERIVSETPVVADGIAGSNGAVFGESAFVLDVLESKLVITFGAAIVYNILQEEIFTFSFNGAAVLSNIDPQDASFRITIRPSPGRLAGWRSPNGHAMEVGSRDVLIGGLYLEVPLENDLWQPTAAFRTAELCQFTKAQCMITVDQSRRFLRIAYEANKDFLEFSNRTYTLNMLPEYFQSGLIPTGNVTILVYVTAGRLTWSGPSTVNEDEIRKGTITTSIIVEVDGDRLADETLLRKSLSTSVTCVGSNDAYGFCAQSSVMFGGVVFNIRDQSRLTMQLQANEAYDIYETEVVTFRISAAGLQSRQEPNATETHTMTITVVPGQYFLSGFTPVVTKQDIRGITKRTLRLVLTLYGERWLASKEDSVRFLVAGSAGSISSSEPNEARGFQTYRSRILPASSATVSNDGRVLVMQFMPVVEYELNGASEIITVDVAKSAVRSGVAPTLSQAGNTFTILDSGGLITMTPDTVSAAVVRSQGVNLTFEISQAVWERDVVQNPEHLRNAVTSDASPGVEPKGFSAYISQLMSHINQQGANINGSKIILLFRPVADFNLIAPETWTVKMTNEWTKEKLPITPDTFELKVTPDFRLIEVTVRVNGTFNLDVWINQVKEKLNVHSTQIEVVYDGPEPNLLELGNEYHRITFRIISAEPEVVAYDNRAAEIFVNADKDYQLEAYGAVAVFYNSTPPADEFWDQFRPNPPQKEENDHNPLRGEYLLIFAGGLLIIVVAIAGYLKYKSGGGTSGVKRAKADEDVGRRGLADEDKVTEAHAFYSGQRTEVPTLNKRMTAHQSLAVPSLDTGLGSTMDLDAPLLPTPPTAPLRSVKEKDVDIPLMLYSGQRHTSGVIDVATESSPPQKEASSEQSTALKELEALQKSLEYKDTYTVRPDRTIYPPHGRKEGVMLKTKSRFDWSSL